MLSGINWVPESVPPIAIGAQPVTEELEKDLKIVSEYVFKLKKGDLELELKSDDAKFIETQMDNWRNMLLTQQEKN
jgi:hypothetical protein